MGNPLTDFIVSIFKKQFSRWLTALCRCPLLKYFYIVFANDICHCADILTVKAKKKGFGPNFSFPASNFSTKNAVRYSAQLLVIYRLMPFDTPGLLKNSDPQ